MRRRRGMIALFFLITGLLCAVAATFVHAKPGVVRTRDGQTYDGDVNDSDADTVVVTVRGIPTRIARDRILSIDYGTADYQKQFAERMAKLGPNDVNGRLALAKEAFNQKQYALARQAAESARLIDPNNADAVSMLDTIQSQMRLERTRTQPGGGTDMTARAGATTEAATQTGNEKLLKPADINIIRQSELRREDAGVRIRFDRDVKKRYISYSGLSPAEFNSMTVNDQVATILSRGTPEMKKDIQVLSDPPALFQYRRQIQPFLIANCATSGCHGGPNAQKFVMVTPAESDAASYTNFYILQHYTKPVRTSSTNLFGHGDLRMIDRQQPERSMLLQYSLPGAAAEYDHPDVPNFRPAVRGVADPRYRQMLDWVGMALRPEDPQYGIDFAVPGMSGSATQPASAPTTQPAVPAEPATRGSMRAMPPTTRPVYRPGPTGVRNPPAVR